MNTIKVRLRNPAQKVSNTVRISDEARQVLQEILDDHDVSASSVVSDLIVQGSKYIEFVRWDFFDEVMQDKD